MSAGRRIQGSAILCLTPFYAVACVDLGDLVLSQIVVTQKKRNEPLKILQPSFKDDLLHTHKHWRTSRDLWTEIKQEVTRAWNDTQNEASGLGGSRRGRGHPFGKAYGSEPEL